MRISDLKAVIDVLATWEAVKDVSPVFGEIQGYTTADGLKLALTAVLELAPLGMPSAAVLTDTFRRHWLKTLDISAMTTDVALLLTGLLCGKRGTRELAINLFVAWATYSISNTTETPDEPAVLDLWRKVLPVANFTTKDSKMAVPAILRPYYFEVNSDGFKSATRIVGRARVQTRTRWSMMVTPTPSSVLPPGMSLPQSVKYAKRAYPPHSNADIIYCGVYEHELTVRSVCHLQLAVAFHSQMRKDTITVANMFIRDLWKSHQRTPVGLWKHAPTHMWIAATAICFALGNEFLHHDHNFGSHGYFSPTDSTTLPFSRAINQVGSTFISMGIADANVQIGIRSGAADYMRNFSGLLVPNIVLILDICLSRSKLFLPAELIMYIAKLVDPTGPTDVNASMRSIFPGPSSEEEPDDA